MSDSPGTSSSIRSASSGLQVTLSTCGSMRSRTPFVAACRPRAAGRGRAQRRSRRPGRPVFAGAEGYAVQADLGGKVDPAGVDLALVDVLLLVGRVGDVLVGGLGKGVMEAHAVALADGTDALRLSLGRRADDVGVQVPAVAQVHDGHAEGAPDADGLFQLQVRGGEDVAAEFNGHGWLPETGSPQYSHQRGFVSTHSCSEGSSGPAGDSVRDARSPLPNGLGDSSWERSIRWRPESPARARGPEATR